MSCNCHSDLDSIAGRIRNLVQLCVQAFAHSFIKGMGAKRAQTFHEV